MALLRTMSHNIKAPPPSPIPTGNGSRSAANETLNRFLNKTLRIPHLALPESHTTHYNPEKIDFPSLTLREPGSVSQFLRSAREIGVVAIGWHEIDNNKNDTEVEEEVEVRALVKETERVFGVLEERDTGYRRNIGGKREEIVWVRCNDERMEWARRYIGPQLYQSFSEKMEKVGRKLEEVVEELGKILVENASKEIGKKRLQKGESLLSIYKYNLNHHDKVAEENDEEEEEENDHYCDYTLSLHLPTGHCEFSVKSGPRLFTFDAGPDTIIVTVGQQLEEWSMGEFKCASGQIIYQPKLYGSQSSFSMELKWSSLNPIHTHKTVTYKKISLADQFFFALIIVFLYSIFISKSSP